MKKEVTGKGKVSCESWSPGRLPLEKTSPLAPSSPPVHRPHATLGHFVLTVALPCTSPLVSGGAPLPSALRCSQHLAARCPRVQKAYN